MACYVVCVSSSEALIHSPHGLDHREANTIPPTLPFPMTGQVTR